MQISCCLPIVRWLRTSRSMKPLRRRRPWQRYSGEAPQGDWAIVGCTSAYRNQSTAKATISILRKLGEDYTLLDESCCGSVWAGGWSREMWLHRWRGTSAPSPIRGEEGYSPAGLLPHVQGGIPKHVDVPFKVRHVSEFLADRNIKLSTLDKKVTYHDPCHLGRLQVYKAPRDVLSKVPGLVQEMPRNPRRPAARWRGGVRSAFPDLSEQIAAKRVMEADFADVLVTTCPFCVNNRGWGRTALNPRWRSRTWWSSSMP